MRKIIGIFFFFFFIFVFLFGKPYFTAAQDSKSDLEKKIQEYQTKLGELRQQKSTLSAEIEYMDTQIYLTTLRIQETEDKIEKTQQEMDLLTTKIQGLDTSLDYFLKMLVKRVVEGYKQKSVSFFDLILNSDSAGDLVGEIKYQKTAQENNQKLLIQVQRAKINYEEQKTLREEKVKELDNLKTTLDAQKIELNNQQAQKQKLLEDTQNSEYVYQNLLAQARAQLSAFSSYVKSSGMGTPIAPDGLGKGSDGNYFSQRDERWAYQIIGNSTVDCYGHPCSVIEAGCLISSVAMTLKKRGADINPSSIASNLDYFQANTALMKFGKLPAGSRNTIYSVTDGIGSLSDVDSQLEHGYVIVGINYGSCRSMSDHFVVLTKKEGNEYKMHDPLNGPDLNFSSKYNQICWAEVIN